MALKILVNGLIEHDSGKTWIIIALYNALREGGYRVGLYKPISGHSGWNQFNTILESIEREILVCEDVLKFLKNTDTSYPVELINPIDFLLMPTDFNIFKDVSEYLQSLDNQYRQGVLVRISSFKEEFTNHYRIVENYDKIVSSLKPWLEKLVKILDPIDIDLRQLFNILSSTYVDRILNDNLKILDTENDIVLIESFNNVSIPYKEIINYIDRILTVTPGHIIQPSMEKARELLDKKLDEYINSEKLISDTGIEEVIDIPPYENVDKLSRYISQNWVKYRDIIF